MFSLKLYVAEFNEVVKNPEFLKKLRSLTLHPFSGMNHELNHMEINAKSRDVNCKIITAYRRRVLVGWALLSQEPSDFHFARSYSGFEPGQGILFQVYVAPEWRRKGIGSEMIKVARKKCEGLKLCICPWDDQSEGFYANFEHYEHEKL